jgi:hypothetical protein
MMSWPLNMMPRLTFMLNTLSGITQDITGLDPFTADVVMLGAFIAFVALTCFLFCLHHILWGLRDKRRDAPR